MSENTLHFTGSLARAARALVETSAADTADAARLTRERLRDFEKGRAPLEAAELSRLRSALEHLGAAFIAEGPRGRGQGVRLKFSTLGARRVEAWEGEGGTAGEDDV